MSLQPAVSTAVQTIRSFITGDVKASTLWDRACKAVDDLSLVDLNHVLYRCNAEERDEGKGGGVYDVPGAGSMVYCGLQGIVSMLAPVRDSNNLGHPICDNLRAGDWMAGYSVNRLLNKKATKKVTNAFYTHTYTLHLCIHIHIHSYVHVYMHIHTCIHTHTHTHTHTHAHAYTHTRMLTKRFLRINNYICTCAL